MMATFDVLQRAAAAGRNMVITHEPTFYNGDDDTKALLNDPTYLAKQASSRRIRWLSGGSTTTGMHGRRMES